MAALLFIASCIVLVRLAIFIKCDPSTRKHSFHEWASSIKCSHADERAQADVAFSAGRRSSLCSFVCDQAVKHGGSNRWSRVVFECGARFRPCGSAVSDQLVTSGYVMKNAHEIRASRPVERFSAAVPGR